MVRGEPTLRALRGGYLHRRDHDDLVVGAQRHLGGLGRVELRPPPGRWRRVLNRYPIAVSPLARAAATTRRHRTGPEATYRVTGWRTMAEPATSNRSAKTGSSSDRSASWASIRLDSSSLTTKSSAPVPRARSTSRASRSSVTILGRCPELSLPSARCRIRRVSSARASASAARSPAGIRG